jgi:hypothetical protein
MKDLKKYLAIDSTLFVKDLPKEHQLNNLLDKALDQVTVSQRDENAPTILWGPERYRLHQAKAWNNLDKPLQEQMLTRITELNLSLSCFIEKSGHNYGAKMILLADSLQEKSIYALFAAEEAIHLREFQNFMQFTPDPEKHWHPMLNPLAKAIEEGEKQTCVHIIQVLLEGFGMAHYGGLSQDCLYAPLKKSYERILMDEARHHGTGVILARGGETTPLEKDQIFEYTREFIHALQTAHWILGELEKVGGELSSAEKKQFWEDIDFVNTLGTRLQKMKEMIQKVDRIGLVERLDKDKVFEVIDP